MKLAYTAFDKVGRVIADSIEAANVLEARELLRGKGLFVSEIKAAGAESNTASKMTRRSGGTARRLKNLAMFTRQMYVLVSTGTPITQSLDAVIRQTRDAAWRACIQRLADRLEEGESLSEAMAAQPENFDPIFQSLVAAGESAGKLPAMLDRLATLIRKQQHVRSSVIGALTYPLLLIVIAVVVLVLMLTFVLPRFAGMFETMEVPLPPTTVMLMWLSDLLIGYWWALAPGVMAIVAAVVMWQKSNHGKQVRDTLIIRMPMVGPIARNFASARIARLMGILLDSYLPMLEVLAHIKSSESNLHYKQLIAKAEETLTQGEAVSGAFNDEKLINISVYEALRNGEETGQIAQLSLTIADFIDEENDVVIKSLTSILEPIILIGMGLMVGFVAISMFMPLFDLTAMAAG